MSVVAALLALSLASSAEAPAGGTARLRRRVASRTRPGRSSCPGRTRSGTSRAAATTTRTPAGSRSPCPTPGSSAEAFDEHYDRERAINTLFVDDETKVVYFELDEKGGYHGLSYYFGPGSGCGYCFSSEVKNTVKPKNGRLQGRLAYKDDSFDFDVTLDVPIPPREWGEPLPKDGGAPGKAFLAYASALEARDKKRI